ncbi:MAG: SDR family oxidoreductase [Muribaculaceae bacterium]|nr:SDR family oxidoreductase [Muribaculaceae bacterium]
MADNYLERKMEDLRNGKLSGRSSVLQHTGQRKGVWQLSFPPRRVLVTGGCHGIGLAAVREFLRLGCKVAVFDIDNDAGKLLASENGVRFYQLDLADTDSLENAIYDLFKAWRDIDIIVNNAGIGRFHPLTESSTEEFDYVQAVNMRPAYIISRLWALHRQKFPIISDYTGRMIIISSTRHLQSEAGTEAYSASKGALASLTHSLMMSLSEFKITVNCISPGWINTTDETLSESDNLQHPSRRVGTPEDIARLAVFLALPDNDFINGADIPVDGGMTRKMIYME